jgi:hypothetical protein
MKTIGVVGAVLLAIAGGCVRATYSVQMRPVPAGMERAITWQRGQASSEAERLSYALPDDQRLALIASLYHQKPEGDPATGSTAHAVFKDAMPQDVGGFGRHATYPTSLGTLHVYAERFRGDDDLAGQWERRQRAIDALVDVAVSWVDEECRGAAGAGALHRFVDHDLRRDARNAVLYGWLALEADRRATGRGTDWVKNEPGREVIEYGLRLGLYGVERGYLSLEELPTASAAASYSGDQVGAEFMSLVRRELVRRAGAELPAPMAQQLGSVSTLGEALKAHVRASAPVRERLAAWGSEAGVQAADPADLVEAACREALYAPFLVDHDRLAASLALAREPFYTNGQWDAAEGAVHWEANLELDRRTAVGLPAVCLALWADPEEAAQTARLGRVVLTGSDLGAYCFWRAGLPRDEAKQWDDFLNGLSPREDLAGAIAHFRFRGRESEQAPPQGAALLVQGLGRDP